MHTIDVQKIGMAGGLERGKVIVRREVLLFFLIRIVKHYYDGWFVPINHVSLSAFCGSSYFNISKHATNANHLDLYYYILL